MPCEIPQNIEEKVLKRLKNINVNDVRENFKYDTSEKKVIKEIINAKTKYVLCYVSICLGFAYYQNCNTQKQ